MCTTIRILLVAMIAWGNIPSLSAYYDHDSVSSAYSRNTWVKGGGHERPSLFQYWWGNYDRARSAKQRIQIMLRRALTFGAIAAGTVGVLYAMRSPLLTPKTEQNRSTMCHPHYGRVYKVDHTVSQLLGNNVEFISLVGPEQGCNQCGDYSMAMRWAIEQATREAGGDVDAFRREFTCDALSRRCQENADHMLPVRRERGLGLRVYLDDQHLMFLRERFNLADTIFVARTNTEVDPHVVMGPGTLGPEGIGDPAVYVRQVRDGNRDQIGCVFCTGAHWVQCTLVRKPNNEGLLAIYTDSSNPGGIRPNKTLLRHIGNWLRS